MLAYRHTIGGAQMVAYLPLAIFKRRKSYTHTKQRTWLNCQLIKNLSSNTEATMENENIIIISMWECVENHIHIVIGTISGHCEKTYSMS